MVVRTKCVDAGPSGGSLEREGGYSPMTGAIVPACQGALTGNAPPLRLGSKGKVRTQLRPADFAA